MCTVSSPCNKKQTIFNQKLVYILKYKKNKNKKTNNRNTIKHDILYTHSVQYEFMLIYYFLYTHISYKLKYRGQYTVCTTCIYRHSITRVCLPPPHPPSPRLFNNMKKAIYYKSMDILFGVKYCHIPPP